MKTSVILTPENIRMELLTADERKRFYEFYQKEILPLEEFRKNSSDKELYDNAIQLKEQQMYREILSVTRPRMNTEDKLGNPILSTDEDIHRREACETQKERDTLNQTQLDRITDIHIFVGGDGYYRIKCSIDGEKQLSERYPDIQRMLVRQGKDIRMVVAEIYEDKLLATREQSQGMKR